MFSTIFIFSSILSWLFVIFKLEKVPLEKGVNLVDWVELLFKNSFLNFFSFFGVIIGLNFLFLNLILFLELMLLKFLEVKIVF